MSRHFIPPLPVTSNLGRRMSYHEVISDPQHILENRPFLPNNEATNSIINNEKQSKDQNEANSKQSTSLNLNAENGNKSYEWPRPFDDEDAIEKERLHLLPSSRESIASEVCRSGKVFVRSVTWNQQAQPFPSSETLRVLLPQHYYHVLAIGTQECENTISKSILYPAKENWEKACTEALAGDYQLVRGHALQASHLAVYVHKAIIHLVSDVGSHAVATGICDTLGNKGGVAISFMIGNTSFCFLTAHLAAHQNQMDRRTAEFGRISREVAEAIRPEEPKVGTNNVTSRTEGFHDNTEIGSSTDFVTTEEISLRTTDSLEGKSNSSCCFCQNPFKSVQQCSRCCKCTREDQKYNPLPDAFDHVVWGGDLNFRIHGTRDIVDSLLAHSRHDVLVDNDQLNMVMQFDKCFAGFVEGPLNFRPTYKFDKCSDVYDTSAKRRIPAWTDRILYKSSPNIKLLSYSSANNVRISDHRPVYASFQCAVGINSIGQIKVDLRRDLLRTESKTEVCVIS